MLDKQKLAYSPKEAAELLGLHLNTIRKHIQAGNIPAKKLGQRILIPARALEDWLQNNPPAGAGGER
jgi:excisionase family DNA binding protein